MGHRGGRAVNGSARSCRPGPEEQLMTLAITRVQLFATCLVDQFYPAVAEASIRVLERLGLTVEIPRDLTCCGQPAFNGGFRAEARAMARHTLDVLARSDAPIVVPSGSARTW